MTKKSVEMLARQYENLDPEVLEIIIRDQVLDAELKLEQQRKSQAEKFEDMRSKSINELTEDLANYNVRTGDRQEQQLRKQALDEKLNTRAEVSRLAENAMSQSDYNALTERNDALVAEADKLRGEQQIKGGRPTVAKLRSQQIAAELADIEKELVDSDGNSRLVLPDKKPEPAPEPPEPKEIYSVGTE